MPEYKLYDVDANGHIRRRTDLEARDDDHAEELALAVWKGEAMELWQAARLVRKFAAADGARV